MSLVAGTRLGSYEVVGLIGAGGMGEVYRARDMRLKRDVAMKVLPGALAADSERVDRFQREAELLAALNHPGIAAIYGFEEADGFNALILELVDGETLAQRVARGRMAHRETLSIARQLVDAFDAAHERGIVHRDLKPANIIIRGDGTVKVLDFGIAKMLSPSTVTAAATAATITSPRDTEAGVVIGTPAYMSPEQVRGLPVDKRADIWSFGCVVYEMLSGRSAFARSTTADTVAAVLECELDWNDVPPAMPPSLARLVRRCLQKDRAQRLRDIADARSDLDEALRELEAPRALSAPAGARVGWWVSTALLASLVVLAAALWTASHVAPRTADTGPAFRRVIADGSFATEPAISRDGSLMVYASDRAGDGQLDLWLQRTAGGQPIRLTWDPADDREPDISPDGSLVAFRSLAGRAGVYVIPVLGGNPRLVAEGGQRPRFSFDGRRITYWTGSWLGGPRTEGSAVFVVAATGGQPTRIAPGFTVARSPVWAPGGDALLFFGSRESPRRGPPVDVDWWWAPLDGSPPVATGAYALMQAKGLSGSTENNTINPAPDALPVRWTRDGVIFSARLGDAVNLWRLQIDGRPGQVIADSLVRLTYGAGADLDPSIDDADRVAFHVAAEIAVSLRLPLDSNTGHARGAIVRDTATAGGDVNGRNSLDDAGRLLVYPKARPTESEIWVKDLATGQERHLATTPRAQLNPIVSHRGVRVAYTVSERGIDSGYVVALAGGTPSKVCDGCTLYGWLADDRRILTMNAAGVRVRLVDVDSGASADVLDDPAVGRVDVSPDSRWLAFSSRGRLWNAPFSPGRLIADSARIPVLTSRSFEGSAERACGWSPDSRLLYLLLERDRFRDLYAQRIDQSQGTPSGEPFLVQHLHDPRRRWGSTPYGTAIVSNAFVFNQTETTASIWLLDPRPSR